MLREDAPNVNRVRLASTILSLVLAVWCWVSLDVDDACAEVPSEPAVLEHVEATNSMNVGPLGEKATEFTNSVGMRFVYVPAGEFQMGRPDSGASVPYDVPEHRVRISRAFFIAVDETSQGVFRLITQNNSSHYRADSVAELPRDDLAADDDSTTAAANNVSWFDATGFAERLSQMSAEQSAKRRYRLPTEAEWEYVCRSQEHPGSNRLDQSVATQSWVLEVSKIQGGVYEWCSDWYSRNYYSTSASQDPKGPDNGVLKVIRDSAWVFSGNSCRLNHNPMPPWQKSRHVGFRLVCDTQEDLSQSELLSSSNSMGE